MSVFVQQKPTLKFHLSERAIVLGLFAGGFALRLPGLFFNGQLDLDTLIFLWGSAVRQLGLGAGFQENYGPFSYIVYGVSAAMAEQWPRFWWLPYKAIEVGLEIAILIAVYRLLPTGRKRWALIAFWLNPWFILHGAWQGFWEGAHTLCAVLAVLILARTQQPRRAWWAVGALLMASALFKPQGLLHFLVPVTLYLILQLERGYWSALKWFVQGSAAVFVLTTISLVLTGGGWLSIPRNYLTATTIMPNLCNGCLSVWRPISTALQAVTGQAGPTYALQLPPLFSTLIQWLTLGVIAYLLIRFFRRLSFRFENNPFQTATRNLSGWFRISGLSLLAAGGLEWFFPAEAEKSKWLFGGVPINYSFVVLLVLIGGIILTLGSPLWARLVSGLWQRFAPRWRGADRADLNPAVGVYLVLCVASLLLAQLGTRSHINHSYAVLVLLIPFVLSNRRVLLAWLIMIGVNFYGHLATYQLGRSSILPDYYATAPTATNLIAQIQTVVRLTPTDGLLQFQAGVNRVLSTLPQEPLISLLAIGQFVGLLVILKSIWNYAATPQAPIIDQII